MKNKRLNRLLIPAVLLVWAGVIWEYAGQSLFTAGKQEQSHPKNAFLLTQQELPSYSLSLDYEDPFLGKAQAISSKVLPSPLPSSKQSIGRIRPLTSLLSRPPLTYHGCVQQGRSKTLAVVQLKKQTYYLSTGDSLTGGIVSHISPGRLCLQLPDTIWAFKRSSL